MTKREELIEKMAIIINPAAFLGGRHDTTANRQDAKRRAVYIFHSVETAGYQIVPQEPSEGMKRAMLNGLDPKSDAAFYAYPGYLESYKSAMAQSKKEMEE